MTANIFSFGNTTATDVFIGSNANITMGSSTGLTTINGQTSIGNTLTVAGNTTVSANLSVASNAIISGNVTIGGTGLYHLDGTNILTWQDSPSSISMPANLDINGNLGVDGNSVVEGTLTVRNLVVLGASSSTTVSQLEVTSGTITLAKGATTLVQVADAGIVVDYVNASIKYDVTGGGWKFNTPIYLDTHSITTTGRIDSGNVNSSGTVTATNGFVGNITGNITGNVAGNLTGNIITASQTNITTLGTLTNLSVTGNVTASGNLVLGAGSRIVCGTGYVENPIFKQVAERVLDSGTISSSLTPSYTTSGIRRFIVDGNFTLNLPTSLPEGGSMTLIIRQDSVGNRVMTADSTYKWAAGIKTLSTAPNSIDMINIFYDGVDYLAVMTKGYVA